jgi:hypothetical protein
MGGGLRSLGLSVWRNCSNLLLRHYSFRNPEAHSIWGNEPLTEVLSVIDDVDNDGSELPEF